MAKTKLELTWIGKDRRPRLEPRILLEDRSKSYHATKRVGDHDRFDNRLIFGDNLLALKALEQEFTGQVKCIYIDPPYNTGSAFQHYDDGVEHSLWLSLMRDRIELLRRMLKEDGSIWITLDDNEAHYMKVLCDEIFGRKNFVATICWKARDSVSNDLLISQNHNFTLLYARDFDTLFKARRSFRLEKNLSGFSNPDNDPRGPYKFTPVDGPGGAKKGNPHYTFLGIDGYWRYSQATMQEMYDRGEIVKRGKGLARKYYLTQAEQSGGATATTWWDAAGTATEAKKEIQKIFEPDNIFDTPKPERMIERVLTLATNPGDLVLDSFAGSGTTGAVAHKMGRRWIMVELGDHCHTHIIPRMTKVIDGLDAGGVTEATGWKGGGGFRYYRLAPSLLEKDKFGNWVVSKQYNAVMLAEAVCKLEGFSYAPSSEVYWQHGNSTERDFIYVTTQTLTREMLAKLSDEVGDDRSLLVCCGAFRSGTTEFSNLTLRKIPKTVMSRCEWGKDDYSLQIAALPKSVSADDEPPPTLPPGEQRKQRKARVTEPSLFAGSDASGNGGAK